METHEQKAERNQIILKKIKAGEQYADIAPAVGISVERIGQIAKQNGLENPNRLKRKKNTPLIIKLYKQRKTLKEISDATGLKANSVYFIIKKTPEFKARKKEEAGIRNSIILAFEKGATVEDLLKLFPQFKYRHNLFAFFRRNDIRQRRRMSDWNSLKGEIIKMRKEGKTDDIIARHFGTVGERIYQLRKKWGIKADN